MNPSIACKHLGTDNIEFYIVAVVEFTIVKLSVVF